ncbi:MAG: hypothetical protein GX774_05745 [Armatimonadetes bacterium]|nr:hypothetical protein [Armatimonadota bacterium]
MYACHPEKVYLTEWTLEDPRAAERARRLAAAMGHPQPEVVTAAELAAAMHERGWRDLEGRRTGAVRRPGAPDVILNAFLWDKERVAAITRAHPELLAYLLCGHGAWSLRDGPAFRREQGCVCQRAWEIHSAFGCLHACDYCHVGSFLNIMTNLEALVERLEPLIAANPWLRLYKYDNLTDTICLEPEYGASRVMVEFFARQPDRYLMLYTKSDNVDHLLGLDHRGHTIVNWSLSGPTSARLIEKGTPSMEARIAAMRKCQEAGYTVRARISPICPVADWRTEATTLVETLFAAARPDLITIDVLGWMNARQMLEAMDTSLFEPRFRAYLEELAPQPPPPHRKHLFSHAWRVEILRHYLAEIRRVSPRTPVSICMETTEMWAELGPELGMEPEQYACCCGPSSVPGHPLLSAAD